MNNSIKLGRRRPPLDTETGKLLFDSWKRSVNSICLSKYYSAKGDFFFSKCPDNTFEGKIERNTIWSSDIQSLAIESLFLGFPLPSVWVWTAKSFGSRTPQDFYQVLKGQCLLNTIMSYCQENSWSLEGLNIIPHLNGVSFSRLKTADRKRLSTSFLQFVEFLPRENQPFDEFKKLVYFAIERREKLDFVRTIDLD